MPDINILESNKKFDFFIWQPHKLHLILRRSDNLENSVNIENVRNYNITIIKLLSGGHSVIISPKNLVIVIFFKSERLNTKKIFKTDKALFTKNVAFFIFYAEMKHFNRNVSLCFTQCNAK